MKTLINQLMKVRLWLLIAVFWSVINAAGDIILPYLMKEIVDGGVVTGNMAYISRMALIMLGVALVNAVVRYAKNYFTIRTAQGYAKNMRIAIFKKVMDLMPRDVERLGQASLITRTTNDIMQVQTTLDMALRVMIRFPVNCLGGIVMVFLMDVKIALILLAIVPVTAVLSIVLVKKTVPMFDSAQKLLDGFNKAIRTKLSGIRIVHAFNKIGAEERKVDGINRELSDTNAKVDRTMAILNPTSTFIMSMTVIGIVLYGIVRIRDNTLMLGTLMASIQYATQILIFAVQSTMFFARIPKAAVSARRLEEVMISKPRPTDAGASAGVQKGKDSPLSEIRFENVTFRYPGAEKAVLEDVSFCLRRGEVSAIIGPTGSGKTTIINLIERFCDVNGGRITFDGTDIREIKQNDLREKLSLSPQRPYVFGGPLRAVLQDGNPNASEKDMLTALKVAQAAEFVFAPGSGLDTVLSQGGSNLSGGQKQRISIARALVRRSDFYLFDDSFSALDFKTDAALRSALRAYTKDAGVVIVSERIGTVKDSDQIIVLDQGKVAGAGRHEALLEHCAVYREIVRSQLTTEAEP
ncbi:MAG: ABC transporter ATP-binding protein [Clostridiales bacterium]|nr:ABC transporter ATP-binding protein [Clostridiales bacterium]